MPSKTVVLCTVALTPELLGDATPRLKAFADGGAAVPLGGVTPAVTATVQSTYLTGLPPSGHGAVGSAGGAVAAVLVCVAAFAATIALQTKIAGT